MTISTRFMSRRPRWGWLLPLLLLVFWLGARGLNADALWYDEWLSVYYAGGAQYGPIAPGDIWARVAERSTWPPGFQTLLAGWGDLVGWTHFAGRMFPLLVGVLAVAWMYRLGRDLASHKVGLAAAVFLGASAFFANYLHELRGYTMYALFSAMCVWSYWRMLRGRGGVWTQATLVLSVVGLLYTHYFATLTAVAVALYHLLFVPKTRGWWRVPLLMAGAALLFLPWAGVAFSTAQDALLSETRRIVPLDAGEIFQTLIYSFSNGSVALLAILAVYSLRYGTTPGRRVLMLAWLWLACVLGIALLVNERLRVIFHVRHLMAVWPALALVCALGVAALARQGVRPALILGVWLLAGLWNTFDPAFIDDQPGAEAALDWADLSAALNVVERRSTDEDALLYHVEEPGREWLTEPVIDFYSAPLDIADYDQLEEIPGLPEGDDYVRRMQRFINDAPQVWLINKPDVPSPFQVGEFRRALVRDYTACGLVLDRGEMQLELFARVPATWDDSPLRFGDGIGLSVIQPPEVIDGQLSAVVSWVVAPDVPRDLYSYALHVTDADGNLITQVDTGLPVGPVACAAHTIDVSALPPGSYLLRAVVYNWQTAERLIGTAGSRASGDHVLLAPFDIR